MVASLHAWLERWQPLADWLVAGGTLLLGGMTWRLAVATRKLAGESRREVDAVREESAAVTEQVELQREQMTIALRPAVYPLLAYEFMQGAGRYSAIRDEVLPLKNGGPGLAVNVHGALFKLQDDGSGYISRELMGGSIATGDVLEARVERPWGTWVGVDGFVTYHDVSGDEWVTHFRFGHGRSNYLVSFHEAPARVDDVGDPRQRYRNRTL